MRFLSIDRIIPGNKLAKPLLGERGTILLRENFELTENILVKLKELGIAGLYIDDEISKDIYIEDVIEEKLRLETAYRLEEIMRKNDNVITLLPYINEIVDSIIDKKDVVVNMNKIYGHHQYTYVHSVNVGILATLVGLRLNLSRRELMNLGTAGVLHDVGKKFVPIEILDKPSKLTAEEYEFMKQHPMLGYEMLKESKEISSTVRAGVLQHHERFDGSGYPLGLNGSNISLFGRILAVTDTYDAMTSNRSYNKAIPQSEVIEYLMGDGNRLYDINIVSHFIKCVAVYPVGSQVMLSTGETAIVVRNYADNILRPMVRCIKEQKVMDLHNDYLDVCVDRVID